MVVHTVPVEANQYILFSVFFFHTSLQKCSETVHTPYFRLYRYKRANLSNIYKMSCFFHLLCYTTASTYVKVVVMGNQGKGFSHGKKASIQS